jgi:hypothetical protein
MTRLGSCVDINSVSAINAPTTCRSTDEMRERESRCGLSALTEGGRKDGLLQYETASRSADHRG